MHSASLEEGYIYLLSSCNLYSYRTPALLLRIIFCSVCTLTTGSPCSKITALITSKFTNFEA